MGNIKRGTYEGRQHEGTLGNRTKGYGFGVQEKRDDGRKDERRQVTVEGRQDEGRMGGQDGGRQDEGRKDEGNQDEGAMGDKMMGNPARGQSLGS